MSKTVAQAMAEGIRKRAGASIGVGITGIAGPGGGTPEKPVGLVYISLADEKGTQVREFRFPGDREARPPLGDACGAGTDSRRIRN